MSKTREIGDKGEQMAVDLLQTKAYQILERNWRFSRAEIDIIAKQKDILVFVEVKTRSTALFGEPEEFLSAKQEALITDAAAVYMEQIGHEWEIRFDIISIILQTPQPTIRHFEDAFFPGW